MGNLRTKDLSKIGYHNDQLRSLVIGIASKNFKHHSKQQLLEPLTKVSQKQKMSTKKPLSEPQKRRLGVVLEALNTPIFSTKAFRNFPKAFFIFY